MMEENASIKAGVIAAAAGVGFAVLSGIAYCLNRQRSPENGLLSSAKPSLTDDEEHNAVKAELMTTKSDNELDVDSDVSSLPSPKKKHFLEREEAWERAMYLFPGLVEKGHTRIGRRVQTVVSELLSEKVAKLKEQDGARFDYLMQQGKAVELCLELGLNETVVRKRYEAISNFQQEFNIVSKTPTLLSIRHLIRRIGVNNPFGEVADIDGLIRERYMGKNWLSYLGIPVNKGYLAHALSQMNAQLNEFNFNGSYVHGTTATALWKIVTALGQLNASKIDREEGGERHDFGPGVYCFKGELKHALSFAIDRCWPIYSDSDGSLSKHNPAVILFPNPRQFRQDQRKQVVYHVEQHSFSDKHVKNVIMENEEQYDKFQEFEKKLNLQKNSKDDEYKNWKTFVKLSRFFCEIPAGKRVFIGWLHDCYSTALTDQCAVPKIDKDCWIQYCFTDPKDLGNPKLFIEFDVDWNDWVPDGTSDEEAEKGAKSSLSLELKNC